MSLPLRSRFGAYEILAIEGIGGMGEVYRARDTGLHRDVALKILPDRFLADSQRLARFKSEAQILASLNHPNIAVIHGVEEAGGREALVLELVDGETLADRIARGPILFADAVPIARQMADALEAAHEKGVIHRDLKPSSIKVRRDGTVKILDFGLAKALDPALSGDVDSPTMSAPASALGVILGTAAYMSPEQAQGRPAGKRSDIWAFGCVFYEMLTGQRAFEGGTASETLAAVLKEEPPWDQVPSQARPCCGAASPRIRTGGCVTSATRWRGSRTLLKPSPRPALLTALDPARKEIGHFFPKFLPDGRHFIYLRLALAPDASGIYLGSIDARPEEQPSTRLVATRTGPEYVPSPDPRIGHVLFLRDGTLMAQKIDQVRLELKGDAVPVVDRVQNSGNASMDLGFFSVSTTGVLVFRPKDR